MTQLLERAFAVASRLSDAEQDAFASLLLEELNSQRRWSEAFGASQVQLAALADEALRELEAGETQPMDCRPTFRSRHSKHTARGCETRGTRVSNSNRSTPLNQSFPYESVSTGGLSACGRRKLFCGSSSDRMQITTGSSRRCESTPALPVVKRQIREIQTFGVSNVPGFWERSLAR
jgi:hypothetical protein